LGVKYALGNILNIIDEHNLDEIHTPFIGVEPHSGDFLDHYLTMKEYFKYSNCNIYLHLPYYHHYNNNNKNYQF